MGERTKLPTIGPLLWYLDPMAAIAWLEQAFGQTVAELSIAQMEQATGHKIKAEP